MGKKIRFWLECKADSVRCFFQLLKRFPGFYKLNRFWDYEPREYWDIINNYIRVMYELTDGHLSKASHSAQTVIDEVYACMDKRYRDE